jgi:hypothetical protein
MVLEEVVRGIVVSTADHFTLRAHQAAKKIEKQGLHLKLVDRGILDRMLEPLLPDRPWLQIVRSHNPEMADLLASQVPSDCQLSLF